MKDWTDFNAPEHGDVYCEGEDCKNLVDSDYADNHDGLCPDCWEREDDSEVSQD